MYLFKKVVSRFFFPVPLSLELIWVGLLLVWLRPQRQMGKWIISSGVVVLTLLSFHPISNALLSPLESQYPPLVIQSPAEGKTLTDELNVKWIVVLAGGALLNPDRPLTSQLLSPTLHRLTEGVALYRKIPDVKLLVSGPPDEVKLMAEFAFTFGVSKEDIVLEAKSRDTKDHARFIAEIVKKEMVILVTEASHMPRSMALFRKKGLSPIPAPVGHRTRDNVQYRWWGLFPNARSLQMAERAFYEYMGLGWAALRGQI